MKPSHSLISKQMLAVFLQAAIALIGLLALIALLWEPQLEGVNATATLYQIYFTDPFLIYVYLAAVPFFIAFYQAIKILQFIKLNQAFSPSVLKSFGTIKHCALAIIISVTLAGVYLKIISRYHNDDPAGALMLSLIIIAISTIIAATTALLEQVWSEAINAQPKKP